MRVAVLQQMNFDNLIARDRVITAHSCTLVALLVLFDALLGAVIGTEFITEFQSQLRGQSTRQRSRKLSRMTAANSSDCRSLRGRMIGSSRGFGLGDWKDNARAETVRSSGAPLLVQEGAGRLTRSLKRKSIGSVAK